MFRAPPCPRRTGWRPPRPRPLPGTAAPPRLPRPPRPSGAAARSVRSTPRRRNGLFRPGWTTGPARVSPRTGMTSSRPAAAPFGHGPRREPANVRGLVRVPSRRRTGALGCRRSRSGRRAHARTGEFAAPVGAPRSGTRRGACASRRSWLRSLRAAPYSAQRPHRRRPGEPVPRSPGIRVADARRCQPRPRGFPGQAEK